MAMTSLIIGRGANITNSATRYIGLESNYLDTYGTASTTVENVAVGSGTLQNFSITLASAPGAGTSVAFTITKNGSDTAITCTIADAATNATDVTNTVSYSQGDTLGIKIVPTNTPTSSAPRWGIETVASAQHMFTKAAVTAAATRYSGLQAGTVNATANLTQNVASTAGNITAAYIYLSATPTANSIVYTLYINGVSSAATVTVSSGATTGSWSGSVAVAAGDLLYWEIAAASGTGNPTSWVGTEFTPTTNGESMQFFSPSTAVSASGNNYVPHASGAGTPTTTETARGSSNNTTAWTLKRLYVNFLTAPGGSTSYTATVRSNAGNTSITTTVTGAATTGNDTSNTATATASGLLTINFVGASTPATSVVQGSFVTYLAGATDYTQNLSDTDSPTDDTAKVVTHPIADTITPTDDAAKVAAYIRAFTDSVTPSDVATPLIYKLLALADTITATDVMTSSIYQATVQYIQAILNSDDRGVILESDDKSNTLTNEVI